MSEPVSDSPLNGQSTPPAPTDTAAAPDQPSPAQVISEAMAGVVGPLQQQMERMSARLEQMEQAQQQVADNTAPPQPEGDDRINKFVENPDEYIEARARQIVKDEVLPHFQGLAQDSRQAALRSAEERITRRDGPEAWKVVQGEMDRLMQEQNIDPSQLNTSQQVDSFVSYVLGQDPIRDKVDELRQAHIQAQSDAARQTPPVSFGNPGGGGFPTGTDPSKEVADDAKEFLGKLAKHGMKFGETELLRGREESNLTIEERVQRRIDERAAAQEKS